jgi:hypothetical protein
MRVTLFNLKKPTKFSYAPRHYDPAMEDLKSRVKIIQSDIAADENETNLEFSRSRIRKSWNTPEARKSANQSSSIRIFIIAFILFGFFYL